MRWIPFVFLLGCPVEPKDVQDLNQGNQNSPGQAPQKPGNNNANGQGNGQNLGKPPGSPPTGTGDTIPSLPTGDGQIGDPTLADGTQPLGDPNIDPNTININNGAQGELPPIDPNSLNTPEGGDPNAVFDPNAPMPEGGDPNANGDMQEANTPPVPNQQVPGDVQTPDGKHPTPNFEHTPGEIPQTAGDVLPMYQNPPVFQDFIDGDTIEIELTVSGASAFDFEFVVKREGDGRVYPKVLHKQSNATSPVTVTAPANFDEAMWLVITADTTGDGPTPDDLVGGPNNALQLGSENLKMEFTLQADDGFLKQLPWFSQAGDGPGFQGQ